MRRPLLFLISLGAALACRSTVQAEDSEPRDDFEAVFSKASNGYARTKLPDGSFKPETYTFKKGDYWSGEISDPTIDRMPFEEVARVIAAPLASQNYIRAEDPKAAQLLIVVHWGTTVAPEHRTMSAAYQELEDSQRGSMSPPGSADPLKSMRDTIGMNADLAELDGGGNSTTGGRTRNATPMLAAENRMWITTSEQNARMLGYRSPLDAELQRYRYFVVLMAYDLQAMSKQKKAKLLWEARFSISEHRNQFDKQLAAMVVNASRYFGQDSHGLIHRKVPEGRVEIGEVKSLDDVQEPDYPVMAPDGVHVAYLSALKSERRVAIVDIDRPERIAYARLPSPGSLPAQLAWSDLGHLRVTLSSGESFSFDVAGRPGSPAEQAGEPHSATQSAGPAPGPSLADMQALAGEKLPHRKVVILGSDAGSRRFLLLVSGGSGPSRYFVLDRSSDLLFYVGRSERSP